MRFGFYHICCFIILSVNFSVRSYGQIYYSNADTVVVTSKVSTDSSIYVFYTHAIDSLKARCPEAGTPSFKWTKYDTTKNDFSIDILKSDSIVSGLPSGGYQVHITSTSGYDHYFVAWVYMDSISVTIEKDVNKNIKYNRYFCENTDIPSTAKHSKYIYYDTKTGKKQPLAEPAYLWSAIPEIPIYSSDNASWLRVDTSRLPLEKATFYLQIKDQFGRISKKDSAFYTPIICKAIIGTPKIDSLYIRDSKNSAPLPVTFPNQSKNAVTFMWYYTKKDTSPTMTTMDSVKYTFRETGTFTVKLMAQSKEGCVDTAKVDIVVASGQIGAPEAKSTTNSWLDPPNCFFPGTEKYPYYKIYNLSIRHFKFIVFSKWGRKVYEFEGADMLNGWDGWNGNINGNGPEASAGIYFYVLEVISYDKTVDPTLMNPKGQYKGFFYLFR